MEKIINTFDLYRNCCFARTGETETLEVVVPESSSSQVDQPRVGPTRGRAIRVDVGPSNRIWF